ncbi:ribonucleases P/MRP protein subunit Pop1p [Diutina catenulata]
MAPPKKSVPPGKTKKQARLHNSRAIRAELTDPSFDHSRQLNIPEFLSAREYEIRSFEHAQLNSKAASSTRVFQALPRVLRRRTASHNVKRIPKRLRTRALKEMSTSSKKPRGPRGKQLYRLQMRKKLLKLGSKLKLLKELPPSHELYGKGLKLRDKIKLINTQIKEIRAQSQTKRTPLNNTVGSYDNSAVNSLAPPPRDNLRYRQRQRKHVWLPTHVWHAKRFHMVKQYGYQVPLTPTQKCYKLMHRKAKESCIAMDASYYDVMVVSTNDPLEFFLRYTKYKAKVPASLIQGRKSYSGWIGIDDTQLGLGLVLVNGDKVIVRVHPSMYVELFQELTKHYQVEDCRYSVGSIDLVGPAALHNLAKVLHVVSTPQKPMWVQTAAIHDSGIIPVGTTFTLDAYDPRMWKNPTSVKPQHEVSPGDLLMQLATEPVTATSGLVDSTERLRSYQDQMSTKQLDQRWSGHPLANSLEDYSSSPTFPVVVTKTTDAWTVLLPWYWVSPTWIKLVRIHEVAPGGVRQLAQIAFENNRPSFPLEYPWLEECVRQNAALEVLRKQKYAKRQRKYRQDHHQDFCDPEFLSPFTPSWSTLRSLIFLKQLYNKDSRQLSAAPTQTAVYDEGGNRVVNTYDDLEQAAKQCRNDGVAVQPWVPGTEEPAITCVRDACTKLLPVRQIAIECLGEGTIEEGAKVYLKDSHHACDVVGFVTTANFNLRQGKPTALACVYHKVVSEELQIRNLGKSLFHSVKAQVIS